MKINIEITMRLGYNFNMRENQGEKMKVVFLSNFLNHHQLPFCMRMNEICNGEFYFIQTERVDDERLNMGYGEFENKYPFLICPYVSDDEMDRTQKLIEEADFVITGSSPEEYIAKRLKENKPVIRYTEPFLRSQKWRYLHPRTLKFMFFRHTRYLFKNVWILCNGCYTASDYATFLAYLGKTYKWGYFPKANIYDIDKLIKEKRKEYIDIVWVGRFLKLKHPEMILNTAKSLKADGYKFRVKIIGSGECEDEMKDFVKKNNLSQEVLFLGNMSPDDVRANMEKANIFMFNSDHREGWGAVINEAMNSGCGVISSQGPGSTAYLIEHKKNGLVYDFNSFDTLYKNVKLLFDDSEFREKLGKNAYYTITKTWNANTAADNLVKLLECLLTGKKPNIEFGPASRAKITPRKGMYRKMIKK